MALSAKRPLNGIDAAARDGFPLLSGKRVALLCNHTAIDLEGKHLVPLLTESARCTLVKIFSPEHGITGLTEPGRAVADSVLGSIPVLSLYGKSSKPARADLDDIDLLVIDLQDLGVRCYTYSSTVFLTLEAAAEAGVPALILDRMNPLGGAVAEGCVLEPAQRSFVGTLPVPFRHALTLGELMIYSRAIGALPASLDLAVVKVEGWRRTMTIRECAPRWINPSPNIRSPEAVLLYPGLVLLEALNVSEGRGTEHPFAVLGAPWIDGEQLCQKLAPLAAVNGLRVERCSFTPSGSALTMVKHADTRCSGVRFILEPAARPLAHRFGIELLSLLCADYPAELIIDEVWLARLLGISPPAGVKDSFESFSAEYREREERETARFMAERRASLLYPE